MCRRSVIRILAAEVGPVFRRLRPLIGLLTLPVLGLAAQIQLEVPSTPPTRMVWESRSVLTVATHRKIESFLLHHQHLTGERIFFAIEPWQDSAPQAPEARALFDRWALETSSRGANILLLVTETGPGKFRATVQLGSGIPLPEGRTLEQITDKLEDLSSESGSLGSWDAIAIRGVQLIFTELDSPVLGHLGPDAWEIEPRSNPLESTRARVGTESRGPESRPVAGWAIALFCLGAAGAAFYWTFEQRMTQEVLMGADRWLVFNPRLKLQLRFARRPQEAQQLPQPGRLISLDHLHGDHHG